MRDEELDAIEARANAATEGPWFAEHDCVMNASRSYQVAMFGESAQDIIDSAFIGCSRSDVPALAAVLDSLGPIAKDGVAPGNMGGYKFRRVEDITAALKPLFAKHGVLCVPDVLERVESTRPTAKGGVMFCVDLKIEFRFVGPQGDTLASTVWGQGTDSGDKATQKAVTSAFKTMLSVVFCISDSESDAEAHDVPETVRAPARPAPASKERIDGLVDDVAAAGLADWVRDQSFPWPWTDAACDAIEAEVGKLTAFNAEPAEPVMGRAESKANEAERKAEPNLDEFSDDPF